MKLETTHNNKIKYSGDIVAGSLLITESRKIAQLLLKGVLEISREIGDRRGEGNQLGNMGIAYSNLGQRDKARKYWIDALHIFREIKSPHTERVENWLSEFDEKSSKP